MNPQRPAPQAGALPVELRPPYCWYLTPIDLTIGLHSINVNHSVGPPGIEPGLRAPKARVLPLYDGPSSLQSYVSTHMISIVGAPCASASVASLGGNINFVYVSASLAPVVQWTEQLPSKERMRVRFLPGVQTIPSSAPRRRTRRNSGAGF